ncbi:MAG: hypothetical protein HOP19_01135, partial [Acidobacteria bacterium]|nr:hypothetical protein [Acidobacteriota bacterium]
MNHYQKMNPFVWHRKQLGWTLIAVLALLMSQLIWRQSHSEVAVTNAALPNLQGAAALEHLRQQGLYTSLETAVSAARRIVRPATAARSTSPRLPSAEQMKRDATYLAQNAEQRLRARFTASGSEITPQTGADWRLGLQLRGYGYPGQMRATQPGTIRAAGQRVELRHQTAGDAAGVPAAITEWYENVAAGLEHGFT